MNISQELSKFDVGSKEYYFLQKVFDKLEPNFISKSKEEKVKEARNSLDKSMQKYFALHIFSNAVMKSTDSLKRKTEASTSSQSSSDLSSDIHPLYLNMVHNSLPSAKNSQKIEPFGLNQENTLKTSFKTEDVHEEQNQIYRINLESFETICPQDEFREDETGHHHSSKEEAKIFKESIERNLKDFCIEIIQCTGGIFDGDNWKNALDRTIKDLEAKATLLSSESTKGQSKKQLKEMIELYYKELNRGLLLLKQLLSLHEQKAEFESNLSDFFYHQCKACFLKIKFLEMKILEMTYNEETVPALKKISSQLHQSEQKLKEEENEKTVALHQYLKLGEEFERFVDEYTDLTKQIREQQWAIDELKSKDS